MDFLRDCGVARIAPRYLHRVWAARAWTIRSVTRVVPPTLHPYRRFPRGWRCPARTEHYGTDEEFVYALADAMRDKYRAIVEACFILQIDDPGIATSWDMLKPEPSLADYRKYVTLRIEARQIDMAITGERR
jgi:hypothetical protein